MSNWTTDFFKRRIGETIIETTLLNCGYKVERLGCEIQPFSDNHDSTGTTCLPDLLVTAPIDEKRIYLDVKLQPSHPLKVRIEKARVEALKRSYPETLLIFVSAFNGSINCLEISDTALSDEQTDGKNCYELDLLSEVWKPLWEYFPLVEKGEKTDRLWQEMKSVLADFAGNRLMKSRDNGFFDEEREALKKYVEKHWHPGMLAQEIHGLNMPMADLDEIWKHALEIHAFRFAFEMCGDENLDHPAFSQIMDKVLGRIGDRFITIPYQDIKNALGAHPELYARIQVLEDEVRRTSPWDAAMFMMEGLLEIIPPGIGTAWVMPEKGSGTDPIEVDLRTILTLLQRRNCLYD